MHEKDVVIAGGRVVTPQGVLEPGTVYLQEGRITGVKAGFGALHGGAETIDAQGLTVAPGLIDLHVHGAMGHDTMDATPEALAAIGGFLARHGVTSYLATTMAATPADTLRAVGNAAGFLGARGGAELLGVHLEGPYLNAGKKGAQRADHVRAAQRGEYEALLALGAIRLITLAPEAGGALDLIRLAVGRGVRVSLGHTEATYDQVMDAVDAGLSQVTHTFNGMAPLHHREPGAVGAALTCDALYAQLIVDLVHLHPAVVRLAVRAKGTARIVLVSDAMRATGLADGAYDLGGQEVIVRGGEARLTTGVLAGSTLSLDRAVAHVMQAAGVSLEQALEMASATPARSLGLEGRKGGIAVGQDADLVLLDEDLTVVRTWVGGMTVYQR
ncbi:MAG: N-acetylglucosamine-6-phosphate deacetylase [Anaerolineae bacterium]